MTLGAICSLQKVGQDWEMVRAPQQPHSATANKQTGAQLPAVRDPASPLYRVSKAQDHSRRQRKKTQSTSIRRISSHAHFGTGVSNGEITRNNSVGRARIDASSTHPPARCRGGERSRHRKHFELKIPATRRNRQSVSPFPPPVAIKRRNREHHPN
jgi:hypothetical protein